MVKAIALDLLAHITRRYRNFWGDFGAFGGRFGGHLVNGEGRGSIALDLRGSGIFWANFWSF